MTQDSSWFGSQRDKSHLGGREQPAPVGMQLSSVWFETDYAFQADMDANNTKCVSAICDQSLAVRLQSNLPHHKQG